KLRTQLEIKTIGARDSSRRARRARRRLRNREYQRRRREAAGARPHSQSLSATQPWREQGMSRPTWDRKNKARMTRETDSKAVTLLTLADESVSVERVKEEFERGFASKEGRGYSSSRTVVHVTADRYVSLPLELRLLALGLPIPENPARENHAAA